MSAAPLRSPHNPGRPDFPGSGFETLAYPLLSLPLFRGVQALVRVRPYVCGLPTTRFPDQHRRYAGFIKPAISLAMKTTKCPESLCPVLRYLPLERRVPPLLGGHCPSSSLLRTHAPNPPGSPPPSAFSLVRGVFAGRFQPLLPTGSSRRYLCESFLACLIPYPGGSTKCSYLLLLLWHRPFPKKETGRLPQFSREHDFPRGRISRMQIFLDVQASKFACLPDRSYRCNTAAGQPRLLLPGRTRFVISTRTGYATVLSNK